VRLALEELCDRCVPAVVTEFPLGTAPPTPQGITDGPDGALWYTDPGANKIGRISTSGAVTEYTLPTANSSPTGITTGPDGNLWFTEFGVDRIGRLVPATGVITEFSTGITVGAAPEDIVTGPDGNLWFTESGDDKIGQINPTTGVITEFSTGITAGSTPFGIADGPDGRLWFTEFSANQIGAITTAGVVSEFSTGVPTQPTGITTGPNGNLYFGSNSGAFIGQITPAGVVTTFSGFGNASTAVQDIVTGPDNALWFTEGSGDMIGRAVPNATATSLTFTEFSTGITPGGTPTDIADGPDGNLWFTEPNAPAVSQITTAGAVSEFFLRASNGPANTTTGPNGTVWFTESASDKVGHISTTTNAVVEYYLPATGSNPTGITLGPDGAFWFTEFGGDRIGRITPDGVITEFSTGITVGAAPEDIVTGPDGNLWFTESGDDKIGQINPTTGVITEFSTGITAGSTPFGITVGPDGNLWFTEFSANQIGVITTGGTVSEFPAPGVGPLGITAGPDGALWFTENTSSAIGRITTAGVATQFSTPTATSGPTGIVAGPDGALWFTEMTANQIGRITTGGTTTELATGITPSAGLDGIIVGPDNNLWFAESTANQIGQVALSADLSITNTDGVTQVTVGQNTTYTIVVSNAGPDEVGNAMVTDTFPGLTGVTWTATFTGGATGTPNGSGPINESVDLPSGGSVTYTATGTVIASSGNLVNTATVSSNVNDPDAANNTATDTDTINQMPLPGLVSGLPNGTAQLYTLGANGQYNLTATLQPFGNIPADVRTAVGDVNGDGIPDYIFATGPGVPFEVTVLSGASGNPVLVAPFDPFLPAPPLAQSDVFTAGGFVSAGDFMGNGRDQIVISPDQSGGPRIAIYDMDGAAAAPSQPYTAVGVNTAEINPGSGLTRVANFLSVNADFRGGARTAVGDLNGDGIPDLAIAAGFGGGPAVLVINGTRVLNTDGFTASDDLIGDFFAFNSTLRDGAYLAIGDVLGNGQQDLILGPGDGGPAEVEILSGEQLVNQGALMAIATPVALFSPTGALGTGGSGLRVAAAPSGVEDQVNVAVASGRGMSGTVKAYPGTGFTSGSTSEPTGGQLLNPFGTATLTDGVFVG
jgi:uncharacterized repeat protein (TIGR01451 family)